MVNSMVNCPLWHSPRVTSLRCRLPGVHSQRWWLRICTLHRVCSNGLRGDKGLWKLRTLSCFHILSFPSFPHFLREKLWLFQPTLRGPLSRVWNLSPNFPPTLTAFSVFFSSTYFLDPLFFSDEETKRKLKEFRVEGLATFEGTLLVCSPLLPLNCSFSPHFSGYFYLFQVDEIGGQTTPCQLQIKRTEFSLRKGSKKYLKTSFHEDPQALLSQENSTLKIVWDCFF